MKKTKRKNVLIYLMALLVSLSLFHNKNKRKENVDLTDNKTYSVCGTYSRGKVYICDSMHDAECASLVCGENDVIVVDPPRSGLDSITISKLLDSGADKIVYVSCNPITLARDVKLLSDKYEVCDMMLFDMFPNTKHVESVVKLVIK